MNQPRYVDGYVIAIKKEKLNRLGLYLVDNQRTTTRYDWQCHESEVTGYSDSDWPDAESLGNPPVEE